MQAANSWLEIRLDPVDYSLMPNEASLARHSPNGLLADWDVVTCSDIILAQTLAKTNNFILQQVSHTSHINPQAACLCPSRLYLSSR